MRPLPSLFHGYRHLVEFRADRMSMAGEMLYPDTQEGLLYLYEDDFWFNLSLLEKSLYEQS